MKRLIFASVALAALTATSATQAQSFLESMARRAAEGAASRATSALERGLTGRERADTSDTPAANEAEPPAVMRPRATGSAGGPATPSGTAPPVVPGGPAPWPNNLDNPRLARPGQLRFDAALEAEKQAFRTFGEVDCSDCEGGVSFDGAAKIFLNLRDYWAFDSALGALEVGQSLTWRGRASTGRITAVGASPVGPFPCKQLRWELTRGQETASRSGLVCYGKSNPDADAPRWIEVF